MKAFIYEKYGNSDVLQLKEVDKPDPKDDEVLIKVFASSINSWDWDLLTGTPRIYRLMFGLFKPKMKIIGCDMAGVVEAVGKNVTNFKIGDAVYGDLSGGNWGCFAEYVCANENELAVKPRNITFEEAASLPQAGVLALQGLRKGAICKGQKVLINGAGGGVGTLGIQIAKIYEAEITVVDAASKLQKLKDLGAYHTIDFKMEDYTKGKTSYDLILDMFADKPMFSYSRILKPNASFVMIGGKVSTILNAAFLGSLLSKFSSRKIKILVHRPNAEDQNVLKEMTENGLIIPVVDKVFPFTQLPEAFKYYENKKMTGKIVISMKS